MQLALTPEILIEAYRQGVFPMAYDADSPYVHWVCPDMRGQLSIADMHIPRSLKKRIRQGHKKEHAYTIKINTDFAGVIHECAALDDARSETWINEAIIASYIELHKQGHAHSVEYWCETPEGERLMGGLYGLAIGGAFFGESMFSRAPNASKIALVHLAARLYAGGFELLDTQFVNDHLVQFGVYELAHDDYMQTLGGALDMEADFEQAGSDERDIMKRYFDMRRAKA